MQPLQKRNRGARLGAARSAAVLGLAFFLPALALASTTNGTIDSTYKYAWSDAGGYVNFAATNGAVHVFDDYLTGYAWSAYDGWINLAPTNGGVKNNSNGTLSGFAWDETNGWISFTGVTIDSSGKFHGEATGANANISFDCTNCDVRTDWRPYSTRSTTTTNGSIGIPSSSIQQNPLSNEQPVPATPPTTQNTTNPNLPPGEGTNPPQGSVPPSGAGVVPTSRIPSAAYSPAAPSHPSASLTTVSRASSTQITLKTVAYVGAGVGVVAALAWLVWFFLL